MTARYGSEHQALKRADVLRQKGTWPGVLRFADGTYGLTYDPQDAITMEES